MEFHSGVKVIVNQTFVGTLDKFSEKDQLWKIILHNEEILFESEANMIVLETWYANQNEGGTSKNKIIRSAKI